MTLPESHKTYETKVYNVLRHPHAHLHTHMHAQIYTELSCVMSSTLEIILGIASLNLETG
jgi:hypothetical protein